MTKIDIWKALLEDTVEGLRKRGFMMSGGSDVFRLLHDKDDNCLKVFLNNYQDPTHIVVRYSSNVQLESLETEEKK